MTTERLYDGVVLAGQRGGITPLSAAAEVAVDVLVPVGGCPALERVLNALKACRLVRPAVVVGPRLEVLHASEQLRDIIARSGATWLAPRDDPASSAMAGMASLQPPLLVTTGDHALLTPDLIDGFSAAAAALDADFVVGLVPYDIVKRAYPRSRRTVLRFADGGLCGSNLFFVRTAAGRRAFEFWRDMQHERKHPQRIARRIGWGFLLKYACGRLTLDEALGTLSARAECRVGAIRLDEARAAVDVDSVADWRLAQQIVQETS